MKKPYNGHESWAAYNVHDWLNNDEGLYRLMQEAKRLFRHKPNQVCWLKSQLPDRTPDGARYSLRSIMLAMED